MGQFEAAVKHLLEAEPRCPYCGETNTTAVVGATRGQIEQVGLAWFCNTCAKTWAVALPSQLET